MATVRTDIAARITERSTRYHARAAQEAESNGCGDRAYWDYLERAAHEHADYCAKRGDAPAAARMLTRTLGEALAGNDGA